MSARGSLAVLALCLVPALALRGAQAQETGGVEGRVLDASGRPLATAEVLVERPGASGRARSTTDAAGGWRITRLIPGGYRVTVRRVGYRPRVDTVLVAGGRIASLTAVLQPIAFLLDSLVVSAPALRIVTTNTELATRLTVDEISLLPTTTDVRRLIALTPGARPDQIWGGASDQANSYILDGTAVNHVGLGGSFFLPSPTWIESIEVRGLGSGAEIGSFQGGLVELVTLSGGNRFEGALRTAVESHRLNGSNLIPGEIGRELGSRQELDGQFRGPLKRNRLHFALFGHLIRDEERVLDRTPAATATLVGRPPTRADFRWLGKLSWKPGEKDLVQWSLLGRNQRGDRAGQSGYESPEATERLRHWNLTGNVTWKRSASAQRSLEVRFGGYVSRERRDPYGGAEVPGVELFSTGEVPRYHNAAFRTRAEPSHLSLSATLTASQPQVTATGPPHWNAM